MSDVKFKGTSDFRAVKKDYEQLAKHTAKVESENAKLVRTTQRAGKAGKLAFGRTALSDLRGMATGVATVGTAIAAAKDAMAFFRDEADRGFESIKRVSDETRRLNQIALTGKDLTGLQATADRTAEKYGISRGETAQLLFSARSEGFEGSFDRIASLNQVVSPESTARVAGQMRKLFPDENLTTEQSLNMVFVGARESRMNFETMSESLPKLVEGAGIADASPSESVALSQVLSSRFATGKATADRGKAFGTAVGLDPRLKGLGIVGAFDKLRNEFSEEDRTKFLGKNQELNAFYVIMADERDAVVAATKRIKLAKKRAGTPESAIEKAKQRALHNPRMIAQRKLRSQEISKELIAEQHAMGKVDSGAGEVAAMRGVDSFTLGRWTGTRAAAAAKYGNLSAPVVKGVGIGAGLLGEAAVGGMMPGMLLDKSTDKVTIGHVTRSVGHEVLNAAGGNTPNVTRLIGSISELVSELRNSRGESKNNANRRAAQQERQAVVVE